jgi:hypothetical protein
MNENIMFRRFGYLRDPLFLACVLLYVVNRFWIKPNCNIIFFHAYLNDVICIPFTVPPMLWMLRCLRFRFHDAPPILAEIIIPLLMISWAFEIYLPNTSWFREVTVADPLDILAYTFGAIAAGLFWFFRYKINSQNKQERDRQLENLYNEHGKGQDDNFQKHKDTKTQIVLSETFV